MNKGIVLLFCLLSFGVKSQVEETLLYFSSEEFNGNVFLNWSIAQGYSCNGVKVERSLDSVNYEEIGSIEGICGSNSEHTKYDFTDLNPILNKKNYYRLHLGGVGFSWANNVLVIDLSEDNYLLYPNPITSESKLSFDNNEGLLATLKIYSLDGSLIAQSETNDELFQLSDFNLNQGNYLFTITIEASSTFIRGKILR